MNDNLTSSFNLYHGTTKRSKEKIFSEKIFLYKSRPDHWLGDGVYFFVDDVEKALWWSQQAVQRFNQSSENRRVLFVENYKIKRKKLLDLDTENDRKLFLQFFSENKHLFEVNLESTTKEKRMIEARSKMISLFVDYHRYYAVKYTFTKENIEQYAAFDSLGISNNEVQFCIVNTDTIDFDAVHDITWEVI